MLVILNLLAGNGELRGSACQIGSKEKSEGCREGLGEHSWLFALELGSSSSFELMRGSKKKVEKLKCRLVFSQLDQKVVAL